MTAGRGGGGTEFRQEATDAWGSTPLGRAPSTVLMCLPDTFPEALFRITTQPTAMRAAAAAYRTYGTSCTTWDRELDGLDAPYWQGTEGDAYRQARLAYRPMLRMAAISFPGVAREVETAATTIEAIIRTMDAVRESARTAWLQLQSAKVADESRKATSVLARMDPSPGPRILSWQRDVDQLSAEASALQRRIIEAATQAAAAIDRLPPPGAVPSRGTDPFGPIVEERQTHRSTLEGAAKIVMGGVTFKEITERLSDGTYDVRYVLEGQVGSEQSVDSDLRSSQDDTDRKGNKEKESGGSTSTSPLQNPQEGVDEVLEQLPDQDMPQTSAEVSGEAALAEEHIWTGSTKEEAQAKARAGLQGLIFGGLPGVAAAPKEDGRATSGRITLSAEAMAGLADAKIGGQLSSSMGFRDESRTDGRRSTSMYVSALGEVEHPVPTKNGLSEQKTYGGSGQLTATVRTTASGAAWLDIVSREKKPGDNKYNDVLRRRAIMTEQARFLRRAPRDLMLKRDYSKTSDCVRALALIADTAALTKDSPEVRSGLVDYKELTYESETTNEESVSPKLFGIGGDLSTDRTTERLMRQPPRLVGKL